MDAFESDAYAEERIRSAAYGDPIDKRDRALNALREYDRTRSDMRLWRDLNRITLEQERGDD